MAKKPGFCDNLCMKTEIWLRNPVSGNHPPGFWNPTAEFWVWVGHGAIDISRFLRYLNVAVLLRVLNHIL